MVSVVEHVEQFADGVLAFERVAHRDAIEDVVVISTTDLLPPEVPGVLEIVEDSLHRTGCDPDHVAEVALTQIGVAAERYHHVGVIGEERPRR